MPYRHAPGTIWRRALARVNRRARIVAVVDPVMHANPTTAAILAVLNARADLREATRLANRLAVCAGVTAPRIAA